MVSSLLKPEVGVESAAVTSDQPNYFLTEEQMTLLEALQKEIRQSELDISHQLSLLQMLVADQSMLSALTIHSDPSSSRATLKDVMEPKVAALQELLQQADKLRLQTLEELCKLLSPVQAARAGVAAFEIVFMMRSMGSNSTLMRSMSASEATFEKAIIIDMLPTIQNLDVPVHIGLALEDSVQPVTLSFPILPVPVLTSAAFGSQIPVSYMPAGGTHNVESRTLELNPELPEVAFVGPYIDSPTIVEKTAQTAPSTQSRKELLPPAKRPAPDFD